ALLESFNDVRNNQSLAHDNPILNYEESLLIFNQVAASIRFIKAKELQIKATVDIQNATVQQDL
ncbi:MAG: abortive infection family protein, partial [Humidesulfovibrio sp.]|nr:abortive infection family protein [Humidesulfovibrio sp.]